MKSSSNIIFKSELSKRQLLVIVPFLLFCILSLFSVYFSTGFTYRLTAPLIMVAVFLYLVFCQKKNVPRYNITDNKIVIETFFRTTEIEIKRITEIHFKKKLLLGVQMVVHTGKLYYKTCWITDEKYIELKSLLKRLREESKMPELLLYDFD